MNKTVVINVVGLTQRLIGEHTPSIAAFKAKGNLLQIKPVVPAVTCTVQATYLTGKLPSEHGIVGNGWFFKDEQEVKFWRQSNLLVRGDKIWDNLKKKDANFTCANLFWWYNMYSSVDYSVTPRPNYLADGRKIPDVYSYPAALRDELQEQLGTFPLFHFWGPKTSIKSSQWIADAALYTDKKYDPTLSLIYLPHLDYNLQRHGHDFTKISKDLREIDEVVGGLLEYYETKNAGVILISEYGITDVSKPVHINRVLRNDNWLAIRNERGLEILDAGASRAFAVPDHQLAHIYIKDASDTADLKELLSKINGVEVVWDKEEQRQHGLEHERSGELVLIADSDSWFTYYYWLDDKKAPDFARTVDIHKKPGYDPVEMFTDSGDPWVMPRVAWKLVKKILGFRTLMNIIPLKAHLVKGSHGRIPNEVQDYPVLISNISTKGNENVIKATEVYTFIENMITN